MQVTAQHAKLAAYFNLDNGSGKIRGVYPAGQRCDAAGLRTLARPFRDLDVSAITIRNNRWHGSSVVRSGRLPGFQFIQDSLDYGTVTHHSNMDVYDHAPLPI